MRDRLGTVCPTSSTYGLVCPLAEPSNEAQHSCLHAANGVCSGSDSGKQSFIYPG